MFGLRAKVDESSLAAEVAYLFRVAYRLTGNEVDAEDLVQDVCERALTKAPEFAAAPDCRRWLLRVLYNRFVDGARHAQRSPVDASACHETDTDAADCSADPETLAVENDAESALIRAWARLEPQQQMLLLLRAEGHDLDQIGSITGLDKPALSSRLHRARVSLAKYLEETK
ncbi:MAG: RNA polymerase sigma factor [Gammaproteobacteria bacterium]|nr:RNA polymerase sigma factor [Gammaproteobacteria bacterium]